MKFQIKNINKYQDYVKSLSLKSLLDIIAQPNYFIGSDFNNESATCFLHPNTYQNIEEKIVELKQTNHKLMITSDMECGSGSVLQGAPAFPSLRAASKTNDPMLCYKMGISAAKHAKKVGINWSFSPCVDLILNHQSPITSNRSAGETVEEVIKYTTAYMKGMQDHGLYATLKHFPGEGCTKFDQHLTTPSNDLSKEEWDKTYRKIYQTLIDEGASSVMIGHISLGCYDEINEKYGIYPPASLSYNLITKLLINDLGFEGIVISDATEMGGFCGFMNYYEACCTFLNAGGDILLFTHCDEEFQQKFQQFINDGKITRTTLEKRASKILAFIDTYHETIFKPIPEIDDEQIIDEIVEKSVSVYLDRNNILPIKYHPNLKFAHFIFGSQYNQLFAESMSCELQKLVEIDTFIDKGPSFYKEIAKSKKYDYIICTTGCESAYGTNMITISGTVARNMMNGWTKYDTPVIFINTSHPYFHEEYRAIVDTIIYTYGVSKYTTKHVINKLFDNKY